MNSKANKVDSALTPLMDKRVIKTKRALKESLFRLLEQKSIKQISVTELAKMAEINRSTFYFYYDNIDDMIVKTWDELYQTKILPLVQTSTVFSQADDYREYLLGFLLFCKDNEQIVKAFVNNHLEYAFVSRIVADVRNNISDTSTIYPDTCAKHYLTCFALNGIIGTIIEWIRDDMRVSCQEMSVFLSETYFLGAKFQKNN